LNISRIYPSTNEIEGKIYITNDGYGRGNEFICSFIPTNKTHFISFLNDDNSESIVSKKTIQPLGGQKIYTLKWKAEEPIKGIIDIKCQSIYRIQYKYIIILDASKSISKWDLSPIKKRKICYEIIDSIFDLFTCPGYEIIDSIFDLFIGPDIYKNKEIYKKSNKVYILRQKKIELFKIIKISIELGEPFFISSSNLQKGIKEFLDYFDDVADNPTYKNLSDYYNTHGKKVANYYDYNDILESWKTKSIIK